LSTYSQGVKRQIKPSVEMLVKQISAFEKYALKFC